MSSPTKSITSRYLESLGRSPGSTETASSTATPLKSSSKFNSTTTTRLAKEKPQDINDDQDHENLSPIRKLIKERERAVKLNQSQPVSPSRITRSPTRVRLNGDATTTAPITTKVPKLSYQKPSLQAKQSHNEREQNRETLNRIVSGMSQSPSLKNLNKLKSIENKMKAPKKKKTNSKTASSPRRTNASIDTGRKSALTYEYLCRIAEAKRWLESVLETQIDPNEKDENQVIVDFAQYLRNGILLAELAQKFCPSAVKKIYYGTSTTSDKDYKSKSGFQFKYTENINFFFAMLHHFKLPTDYRFELTDLYDLKNFPKVVFCIHALAYMLATQKKCHKISLLSDEIEFDEKDISKTESNIRGLKIPNFDNFDDLEGDEYEEEEADEETQDSDIPDPHTQEIEELSEENVFDSDMEVKSETDSIIEIPASDDYNNSFGLDENLDSIHKKYESLINEDIYTSSRYSSSFGSSKMHARFSPMDESYGEHIALYLETIIKIQAISRGSLYRYQSFVDKFMLKTCKDQITEFQSITRSLLARKRLHSNRGASQFTFQSGAVRKLQSFVKFDEKDERFFKINGALLFHKSEVVSIQSIIRGVMLRQRLKESRSELLKATNAIIKLQSHIRYKTIKDVTSLEIDQIRVIAPSVIKLQSLMRLKLFQDVTKKSLTRIYSADEATVVIQAICRGNKIRKLYQAVGKTLDLSRESIIEMQSILRGGLSRNRLNNILDTLHYQDRQLCRLASIARGSLVRHRIKSQKKRLLAQSNTLIAIQSSIRGVLSRFEQDSLLDDIEENLDSIIEIQSIVRAKALRQSLDERWVYYNKPQNLQKIIKIQSYIKTKRQGDAYKLLTTMQNPPLSAVKKFIGLLNDSEVDFDHEINLAKTKESIKRSNAQILSLEDNLDQLDLKIEQLTKNKITIDELAATHQSHSHGKKEDFKTTKQMNSELSNGAKIYPKPLREKIEVFEKVVYLLQTKPVYFIRLFNIIEKHNLEYDIGLSENIEDFILKLFSYSLHQENKKSRSREEYLMVQLILESVYHQIDQFETLDEYKNWSKTDLSLKHLNGGDTIWELLILNFNNLVEQRTLLKELFSSNVESVVMDQDLDLESHPMAIYRSLIEDEERRTQKPSNKPIDITTQQAIQDPSTRDRFVANLGNLREISNDFMLAIESNMDRIPIHVRVLCNELYKHSTKRFSKESERFHLSVVGKIFMKFYILPILLKPENYSISIMHAVVNERKVTKIKKNLVEVAKVMYQLVSMRSFSAKNVYLQPLNDYVEQSVELVRRILKSLIDVKDIDTVYDMSVYDDIASDNKPTVAMTSEDCLSLSYMMSKEIDILAPSRSDLLRNFVGVMNSMGDHGFRNLETIVLELIPVAEDDDGMSIEARTLFLQVKRCILYVIQVQDGENLVDLLVSHIEDEHETMFKEIVEQERRDLMTRNIQKPYSGGVLSIDTYDDESHQTKSNDLNSLTYHELKKITLEKILELERIGEVTRQDGFQKLLNEIGNDIKNKHTHRLKLQREQDKASATLLKLKTKQRHLQDQLNEYNREIEHAIASLHSSQSKKKNFWSKLFSRQFFYHRELKKKGRLPQFGSYKYSAKHLYDSGILLEVNGMSLIEYELSASGSSKVPKLDFSFSCDKVGIFQIELRNGMSIMGGAYEKLTLDQLLACQYEEKKEISMFKGIAKFDTNGLIAFIFRKFYDK